MSLEQQAIERVALLYYQDNLTQEEIAARLSTSRSRVVRLLQEARRRGVVQIRVIAAPASYIELERKLEARFNLRQVRVAASGRTHAETLAAVGVEAANWVVDVLKPGDTMVLSSGRSIGALVDAMPTLNLPNAKLVEMQGVVSLPSALPAFGTDYLVAQLAQKLNAQYRMLPVPQHLNSASLVSALLSDERIRSTLELATHADFVVVGIGGIDPPSPTLPPVAPEALAALRAHGAVGEISAQFFDADGQPCSSELDERLVGLKLAEMMSVPVRTAIAFGPEKVVAIAAALTGRLVNVLVTDRDTASALLSSGQIDLPRNRPALLAHATRTRKPNRPLLRSSEGRPLAGSPVARCEVDQAGR